MDIRTAGDSEFHTKPRILLAGSPGVRRTQFATSFPKPVVVDCGSNSVELGASGTDYITVTSEGDLFDLVCHLESDGQYETLVIDTLDGFQDVLLDERLMTEHRNELEAGDWKWLEGRLRTIFKRLKTLPQNLVVVANIRDIFVKNTTVFQPAIQGGFSYKVSQYMTHMLWLRANTSDGETPKEDFYLLTQPVSEAEWVADFSQTLTRVVPVDFKSDYDMIMSAWGSRVVGKSSAPEPLTDMTGVDVNVTAAVREEMPGQMSISDILDPTSEEGQTDEPLVDSQTDTSCIVCNEPVDKVWGDLSKLRFGEPHCESCFKKLN